MNKYDFSSVKHYCARFQAWDLIVAGALLTRLPLPQAPNQAYTRQATCVWAFPLIGLLLGGLTSVIGMLAFALGFSPLITAGLMVGCIIILTGAMHEDGLADCADGFWGGFSTQRRLEIMKDSQIGTYGVLALILVVGLRWITIAAHLPQGFSALIGAMILSRGALPVLMAWQNHARSSGLSASVGTVSQGTALISILCAGALALFFLKASVFSALFICLLVCSAIGFLAQKKIKGQTGDVLGAAQILSETAILLWLL